MYKKMLIELIEKATEEDEKYLELIHRFASKLLE